MNSTRILTALALAILPVTVYGSGCSSGDNSGGGGPVTTEAGTRPIDGSVGSNDGGSDGPGNTSEAGQTDQDCAAMGSSMSCIACCANLHTTSYIRFIDAIVACECSSEAGAGVCQTPCANEYCAMQNPMAGDSCDTCLTASLQADAGGKCLNPVAAACPMGGACDAYLICANGCP